MSDSFADLWSMSAPSSSKSTPPPKLGASLASSSAPQSKPRNDVFSLLSATSSITPPTRAKKIGASTTSSRSLTPSNSRSLTPSIHPRSSTPSQPLKSSDAFADLLSNSSFTTSGANMTIAERAREVERQRTQAEAHRQETARKQASAWDGLDALGSGRTHVQAPHIVQDDNWGLGDFAPSTHEDDGWGLADLAVSMPKTVSSNVVLFSEGVEEDWDLADFAASTPEAASSQSTQLWADLFSDQSLSTTPPSSSAFSPRHKANGATPSDDSFPDQNLGDGLHALGSGRTHVQAPRVVQNDDWGLGDFVPSTHENESTHLWADIFSDQSLSTTPPSSSTFSPRHKANGATPSDDSSPDQNLGDGLHALGSGMTHIQAPHIVQDDDWGLGDFAPSTHENESTHLWADIFSDQSLSTMPPSSSTFTPRHKANGATPSADSSPDRNLAPPSAPLSALALAARYKTEGTAAYKLGQFSVAESAYSRGIASLPDGHLELIPLYNNRAQAKLKGGDYKGACEDCTSVVDIIGLKHRPIDMQELEGDGIGAGVDLAEGFIKAVKRRAEAHEGRERWAAARQDWELLSGMDWILPTVRGEAVRGIGRCRRMISGDGGRNPSKAAVPKRNPKPIPKTPIAPPTTSSAAPGTALANYRSIMSAAEAEDLARHELKDSVDARLLSWKAGKETNIRALLSSLDTVLWPGLGLQRTSLADIVTPLQVKVRYMKAIAKIHPDKLNASNSTLEQRMLANGVFGILNEAWNTFKP